MAVKSLVYQFLDVRVEVARFRVMRGGRALALEPKAIETLLFLLERPGRLIEKDELLSGVWKDSFVTPNALTRIIAQLRRELGDDAKTARIIKTVPTRGYIFLPDVEQYEEELPRPLPGEAALHAVVTAARRITQNLSGKLRPVAEIAEEQDDFDRAEIAASAVSTNEHAPSLKTNEHPPISVETNEYPPLDTDDAETNKFFAEDLAEPSALSSPPRPQAGRFLRQSLLIAFALIAVAAATWAVVYWSKAKTGRPRVIAVLPFKPLTVEGRDESFELGMAESLITKLSSLHQAQVRPLTAVRKYARLDQDPLAAGRELGVDAVLDGSIQRIGQSTVQKSGEKDSERVRVTARLLNVRDGKQLWADNFDQPLTDIFTVQDAIAAKAVSSLSLSLSGAEQQQLAKRNTRNLEAYQLYLQGRLQWQKRTPDGFKRAIEYLQQALDKDPNYALAYSGIASSYSLLAIYGFWPPRLAMPKAEEMAKQALSLDESLAEPHAALAVVRAQYDWNWPDAERELRRAIELNPSFPEAHHYYALGLAAHEHFAEARAELNRAKLLDPTSLNIAAAESWLACLAREYDQAIALAKATVAQAPDFFPGQQSLGVAYLAKGLAEQSLPALQRSRALSGDSPIAAGRLGNAYARAGKIAEAQQLLSELKESPNREFAVAWVYLGLGDKEAALAWLSKSVAERVGEMMYLKADPLYDSLRSDPRFDELLRRVSLTQ